MTAMRAGIRGSRRSLCRTYICSVALRRPYESTAPLEGKYPGVGYRESAAFGSSYITTQLQLESIEHGRILSHFFGLLSRIG